MQRASKEMAREALVRLGRVKCGHQEHEDIEFLERFIEAASRRLPTEEAISRDKARRETKRS